MFFGGEVVLDHKTLGFYNFLGIVSFVINVLLITWVLKPRVIHQLSPLGSIWVHSVLIFLSCGDRKDPIPNQLLIDF